jgi:hypothetical protein
MPTISAHITDEMADALGEALKSAPEKKPGPYVTEAVRRRLEIEGHLPGTPAHDIRAEALAACEAAGPEVTLAALRGVTAAALARRVENETPAA